MKKVYFSNIFAFLFLISSTLFAQEHHADSTAEHVTTEAISTEITAHAEGEGHGEEAEPFNPGKMMLEHIADEHEWHFATAGHTHYSIPLPCIVWNKGGLKFFSSNRFKNEHHENTASYEGLKLEEGKIIAEDGSFVLDLSITKNVASLLISLVLLLSIFFTIAKSYKERSGKAPKGLQSLFEPIIVFIRDEVAKQNIGEKHYKRFTPYLLTVFFFIWFNNMLGLLPGSANVTGNIAVTLVLALIAFFVTNLNGRSTYWGHIFAMPGVPKWLLILLTPVEIIGVFMKPISLMIRLFANITAGHLILLSLIAIIFIFKSLGVAAIAVPFSVFMNLIEILVAFLQAFIFTVLTSTYIGSAVEEGHH
ncbi:F0F1 ATP synthase subunit A [Arcicella sp. LKC2W]|uniref:F0F1 ATP synthase subunit A n=1 Tax=Arcicella sp. LKC2W TaxID=2984198 RepID=UPI002B1FB7CC|nr:F0F1 ATP synthase subunit A [Arcicella sp. LKC2W]MEA5459049.1 F0F1 ATP synthase subunit A [Arcicella sp. LKC2W]